MKRRVTILDIHREPCCWERVMDDMVKQVSELHMDLVLGISDAMTFVHVTELGYRNFVPEKRMVFT